MNLVRHCPRCDVDYRPEIQSCPECGGELESRDEESAPDDEPTPLPEPPPGDYRSLYFSAEVEEMEPLADALARAGIPFRLDTTQKGDVTLVPRARFDLKVRDEEREKARQILSALPEADEIGLADDAAEKGYDPKKGYSNCPACSAALPAGAVTCPECGLALEGSLEPLLCSACGWEVSPSDSKCPNCGASLEE
jgi:predicted amidophosphoribosyltransferase